MGTLFPTGERIIELLEAIGRPVTASTVIECLSKLNDNQSNEWQQRTYDILTAGVRFGYIQRKNGKYYLESIEESDTQPIGANNSESDTIVQNNDSLYNNDFHWF